MTTPLAAAASGMHHYQTVIDVVGNNLANANTHAFKLSRVLAQGTPAPATPEDPGRFGVGATTIDLVFAPGMLEYTADPLHLAAGGDAFFQVEAEDGSILLTRRGALGSGPAENLATIDGFPLAPPIAVPDGFTRFQVDESGVVTADDPAGGREEIGRIALARVANPGGLEPAGNGLYRTTENSGALVEGFAGDDGFPALTVGALEGSNVSITDEFTTLLMALRAYQASTRAFNVGDQMLAGSTQLTA